MTLGDEFHTFHVHGHRWVNPDGTPEDTRTVGPAESFRVRWVEDAPGTWLYHCHVESHMAMGMIGLYRVAGDERGAARGRRPAARDQPRPRRAHADAAGRPATPTADAPAVTMTGQAFLPRDVVALVGEDVTWSNTDARNHTVTDSQDGDAETSTPARCCPARRTCTPSTAQGTYSYRCTIHRFMTGTVRVFGLALDAPAAVLPGGRAHLAGRAPAGTLEAVLEHGTRRHVRGRGARCVPAADGTYAVEVEVHEPGTYRVRAGELTSPAVQVRLTATSQQRPGAPGATVRVDARVTPARARTAVLQRYVRELFDWRTVKRAPIAADGTARFTLRARDEVYLRVVATSLGGGWSAGASRAVRVRSAAAAPPRPRPLEALPAADRRPRRAAAAGRPDGGRRGRRPSWCRSAGRGPRPPRAAPRCRSRGRRPAGRPAPGAARRTPRTAAARPGPATSARTSGGSSSTSRCSSMWSPCSSSAASAAGSAATGG